MSSNISSVYTVLTAYDPTGVLTNRDITAAKLEVADADLPCRILIPATEGTSGFVGIGNLLTITWTIQDVCLWAPVGAGAGVQQYSTAFVTYIKSYLDKVKADRSPAAGCHISDVSFKIEPTQWGSKTYWAINTTVTVEEKL